MEQILDLVMPLMESLSAVRAILGVILVFFLPGFAWTFVFFRQLTIIERIALAIGLSIALVTLGIIATNILLGIRITGSNALVIILVLTIVPVVIYYLRRLIKSPSAK